MHCLDIGPEMPSFCQPFVQTEVSTPVELNSSSNFSFQVPGTPAGIGSAWAASAPRPRQRMQAHATARTAPKRGVVLEGRLSLISPPALCWVDRREGSGSPGSHYLDRAVGKHTGPSLVNPCL